MFIFILSVWYLLFVCVPVDLIAFAPLVRLEARAHRWLKCQLASVVRRMIDKFRKQEPDF